MKRLSENTLYTQKEIFSILGITQCTWNKRKEDWLEHFKVFCEYELKIGARGAWLIEIKHILEDEYKQLPRKIATKPSILIQQNYDKQTVEEIEKEPFHTIQSLAKRTQVGKYTAQYLHSDYTAQKYVRNTVNNENIIHKGQKQWMRVLPDGSFTPLAPQQLSYLKALFKECFKSISKEQEDIYAGIDTGEYTQEEAEKIAGALGFSAYQNAINSFEDMYKFRPKKVPFYEVNTFYYEAEKGAPSNK